MEKYSKVLFNIVFVLIILAQILTIFNFANKKTGMFMDEISTYGLSNYNFCPFIQEDPEYRDHWHDSEYYSKYVEVQENHRFDYKSVFYNQSKDVHPPLYYMLIHTISSIKPNTFTKWYGIGLNMIFFVMNAIVLYLISKEILKNKWKALLPVILWGFSVGSISSAIFIRMYEMLTFFILLIAYEHCKFIKKERISNKAFVALYIISILGALTQYYFLIYLFFIASLFFILLLYNKRYQELLKYIISEILAGVSFLYIFPAAYRHIFKGYRGEEAQHNFLALENLKEQITGYYRIINEQIFGKLLSLFIVLFILILILKFFVKITLKYDRENSKLGITTELLSRNKFVIELSNKNIQFISITIPVLCYLFVISKISPGQTGRYIYCVYPLLSLIFISLYDLCVKNKKIYMPIIVVILFISIIFGLKNCSIEYLYEDGKNALNIAESNSEIGCIYIYENAEYETYSNYKELMTYKNSYITTMDHVNEINDIMSNIKSKNNMILYLPDNSNLENNLNTVISNTMYSKSEELCRYNGKVIFKLEV